MDYHMDQLSEHHKLYLDLTQIYHYYHYTDGRVGTVVNWSERDGEATVENLDIQLWFSIDAPDKRTWQGGGGGLTVRGR